MNKNKQMYLSPETEVLVVRFEDSLLNSGSPYGSQGAAGKSLSEGGVYNFDDED